MDQSQAAQAPAEQPHGADLPGFRNLEGLKKNPWQRKDLARFLSQLPQLTGARNLMQNLDTVTQQISLHVLTHTPDYVEEVGEAGLDACTRDNRLTLLRTAQLLSGPQPRPQEALLWWWDASVGGYLVHRAHAALEANLQGIYQSLDSHLHHSEVKPMVDLLSNMYQEALGLQLKVHSAVQLQTEHLALEGPKWQQLFALGAAHLQISPAAAGGVLLGAANLQISPAATGGVLADLEVSHSQVSHPQVSHPQESILPAKTQKILWAFIDANLQYGDEEAAWSKAQNLIERSLRTQSCAALLGEWRGFLARLPNNALSVAASAYWTDTLLRGLDIIAQVSLGRVLQSQAKRLASEITAHLMRARVVANNLQIGFPAAAGGVLADLEVSHSQISQSQEVSRTQCKRDLALLLEAMGQILIQHPPSLAALNISRYLLQNIAPFVDYSGRVWRLVWLKLQDSLWAELNAQEQNQLLLWVAQLQDLCGDINATRPLGEAVFHQIAPVFGDPNIAEQDWRNLLGGLLSAALTSDKAPYPGTLLTQRLLLSSPVFRDMEANQWQQIHVSLSDSFAEWLPSKLLEPLQQVQASISHSLLRLSICDSLSGDDARLRFYLALPDLPYLAHSWQIYLWAKFAAPAQRGGAFLLNPQDHLLAELNRWALPDAQALQASFEMYASVSDAKPLLALTGSGTEPPTPAFAQQNGDNAHRLSIADEYALNLRCLALYGQSAQLQKVLYANWLFLEPSVKPHTLMSDWFSLPSSHLLAEAAALAQQHLPKFAVARRLLKPDKDLAAELFAALQVNPCIDLNYLLQQLGVSFTGWLPHLDLARWYHDNVTVFISLRTRQRNAKLWSPLVKQLGKDWSPPEQKLLLEAFKSLARPLAVSGKMPRLSVRHFPLQGTLWQQVFHAAAPSPALKTLQQALPTAQLPSAIYQGLEGFCQAWQQEGDIEAAWQFMQHDWQTQLHSQSTAALYRDWQAALPILTQHLNPVQQAYWQHTLHKGLNLLAQTGLGLRLQQHADNIAQRVAQRLATAPQGFNDDGLSDPIMAAAKCRRDQALLLQAVGDMLSQQAASLAALNVGRYLIQNIVPFVNYNTGAWQLIWLVWQDASADLLDDIERQALRQWCEQLGGLSLHLTSMYALDSFSFAQLANQTADDETRLDTLSGLLCAAATPDSAPIAGSYVLQRLVLSSPLFAKHSAASWQAVQAELAQELVALDPSELHGNLQKRYNQIVDLLFKLPRLQEWQNFSGDDIGALLLSAAPAAELSWNLSQYTSAQIAPSAILVQQSNGWSGLQPQLAQPLTHSYQAIRQFDYSQPLGSGKWYQRNQPNNLPAAAIPQLQTLLCQLSLYVQLAPSVPAYVLRQQISQSWHTMQEAGLSKDSLLDFAQLWQQQQAQQAQLAQLGVWLTQQLPAVTAGHKLLHLNFDKYLAKATAVTRCAADARYVLKQMGANLCGETQASPLDCWYAQHVGRFLKPATRQSELQFYNKLPKVWTDVFDAEEQAAIAPLLAVIQQGLSYEPPATQVEWTVSR